MDEGQVTTVFEKNFKLTLLWAGPLVGTGVLVGRKRMCVRGMWCFCSGLRAGLGNYTPQCKNPMWHNEKHTSVLLPKPSPSTGQPLPRLTMPMSSVFAPFCGYEGTRGARETMECATSTLSLLLLCLRATLLITLFALSTHFDNKQKTSLEKRKSSHVSSKSTVQFKSLLQ